MIDWFAIKVDLAHPVLQNGCVREIDEDGVITWQIARPLRVEGSHDSAVNVKSDGVDTDTGVAQYLMISGNPSKLLQGHNVFGSDDLIGLADATIGVVCRELGIEYWPYARDLVLAGKFEVNLIDINYSYELRNQADVQAWIHAAEFCARSRHGRPVNTKGTLYFGKNSRRWAIKMYSKFIELTTGGKKHALPVTFDHDHYAAIIEWSANKLRVELRLLSKQLEQEGLKRAADLQPQITALFEKYRGKLIMSGQRKIKPEILEDMPRRLQSTYILWLEGRDMFELLPKTTFYRQRLELLDYQIDISITVKGEERENNVIPLIRELEAVPCQVPEWAFFNNLVFMRKAA